MARAAGGAFDPWAPDPHDASGAARRPFRRGKTYRAPLAGGEEDGGFGDAVAAVDEEEGDDDEIDAAKELGGGGGLDAQGKAPQSVLRRAGLLGASGGAASPTSVMAVPLRAPLWPQFEELHAEASRKRQALRKARRQEASQRSHVADEAEADAR